MLPLHAQSASRLLRFLVPDTVAGRAALLGLSQEDVDQLRARHTPDPRFQADSFFGVMVAIAAALAVLAACLTVGVWVANEVIPWGISTGRSSPRLLGATAGVASCLAVFAVVGAPMLYLWDRLFDGPYCLARYLTPISTEPALCEAMLERVEKHAACLAYRDAVVAKREILRVDELASRVLAEEGAEEVENAERLARQQLACKKLHGQEPLAAPQG